MNARWARPWFGLTAFLVLVEIVSTLLVTANDESTFGGSPVNRALNIFAFFTIDSNLLIGAVCLLLVIRMNRSSTVFAVFRLTGIVGITVTFIVFHTVLSGLLDLESWAAFNNLLQHTVVPIMAIIGWLAFGPRGLTSRTTVWWTIAFPLLYITFTAIRGPLASDWYPYPFADVHALGYLRVIINGLWVSLLFLSIAAGAHWLEGRLQRPIRADAPSAA